MAHDPWDWYAYQDVGRDRLTSYLRKTVQPEETIRAMLTPFRDLEYLHHQLFDMLSITRATGKGLDAFGEMLKIDRLGRTDDEYRKVLRGRRFSSGGSGTPEEIKRALFNMLGNTSAAKKVTAQLVDHYPAAWIAYVTNANQGVTPDIADTVARMASAGVHGYATFDPTGLSFILAGVVGRAYNALGVAPSPTGGYDQVMGLNGAAPLQPAAGDIVAPAAGVAPLMLQDANGISHMTGPQTAAIVLTVGQVWAGKGLREGSVDAPAGFVTAKPFSDATIATATRTNGNEIGFTAKAPGQAWTVFKGSTPDTLYVSVTVVPNDVLGVNETYQARGGSILGGSADATVRTPTPTMFDTYPETEQ